MSFYRSLSVVGAAILFLCTGMCKEQTLQIARDKNGIEYVKNTVVVGFFGEANGTEIALGSQMFGGTVDAFAPEIYMVRIKYPANTDIFAKIAQIALQPNVKYAEPDHVVHATFTPNDPSWGSQYGPKKIKCDLAWNTWTGDVGTVIAIIDTGVNYNHPDLTGKVALGHDYVNNDDFPLDDNGHGTHCAGIAAANTNNGVGIAGVAFNCSLMAVKVLDSGGSGSTSNVALGIGYAASHGAKVISLSLGGGGDGAMESAITSAWNGGTVVCCAAGNNNSTAPFYPAWYANAIAVASTNSADARSSFSNYGSWVDVAAPGENIYSTYGSGYTNLSGTSMACPHVAGAAALVYSKLGGPRSKVSAQIVRAALENTCDNVGTFVAHGRINLSNAINNIGPPPTEDTYYPSGVTMLKGNILSGDYTSLLTDDNNVLLTDNGVVLTYTVAGKGTYEQFGSDYYVEFNVGINTKLAGTVDFRAASTVAVGAKLYVYKWASNSWAIASTSNPLSPTETAYSVDLPGDPNDYTSNTGQMRIRIQTNLLIGHLVSMDFMDVRITHF